MLQSLSGQMKIEAFSRNISKVFDLKVGIRELSCLEPTEKQPL